LRNSELNNFYCTFKFILTRISNKNASDKLDVWRGTGKFG